MIINKEKDLENFKKSGKELECILIELKKLIKPGMSTMDISDLADHLFKKNTHPGSYSFKIFVVHKKIGNTDGAKPPLFISLHIDFINGFGEFFKKFLRDSPMFIST